MSIFRVTTAADAKQLNDGILLPNSNAVVLPWIGYGTYKLRKEIVRNSTLEALKQGYRCIDTAFIYGAETTERQVGLAIQDAIDKTILAHGRKDVVVITKQWRKFHGYESSMECLRLSLMRLKLDYIDVWLMHWPGPAWETIHRRKDELEKRGPWHYALHSREDIPNIRGETWRAMEDAFKSGKVKAIGVSNFTIQHLERLKKSATIWPPSVNQIECHPLLPQEDLLEYCAREGIVVQAYSSLGGQDAGKSYWRKLYPLQKGQKKKSNAVTSLLNSPPVIELAQQIHRTPAQVLLRWGLEKKLVLVPKSSSKERMAENASTLEFSLSREQVASLDTQFQQTLRKAADIEGMPMESMARLSWRNEPLRDLCFE